MSRPIYTTLYSLMIIGLYFSLSMIYQSCGKNNKKVPSTEELADKVEAVADSYTEETFFEDDDESGVESEDAEVSSPSSSQQATNIQSDSYQSSQSVGSGFMVIAGNYLLVDNATIMVRKLKAQGYNNAEKVVFDLSQYYSVVAGSYESRSIANSVSSELKGKGIDNYVLKRKN